MSKNLKSILFLSIIGISIFLIWDWQRKKINFQKEKISNGWYKYSNDFIQFEYPKKIKKLL